MSRARSWSIATTPGGGWSTPSPTSGVSHYSASVQVLAEGETRSRLIWIVDVLPNAVAPHIDGQMDLGALAVQKALARRAG